MEKRIYSAPQLKRVIMEVEESVLAGSTPISSSFTTEGYSRHSYQPSGN